MDGWTFSKEIPLTFLLLMTVQIIAFVSYLTKLSSRTAQIEKEVHALTKALDRVPTQIPPREVLERLAKIEANQSFIITSLREIANHVKVQLVPNLSQKNR